MQIDIISDFTCPWCLIGKERLMKVLAMRQNFEININWRPFQLHPEVPEDGVDFLTHYSKKFGGKAEAKNHINAVREAGFAEGVQFRYDHIDRVPNTIKAHGLHRLSLLEDKGDEVVNAIFAAYFVEGRDIGKIETLLEIATAVGMTNPDIETELNEGNAGEEDEEKSTAITLALVRRDVAAAVQMGIRVVPSLILNKQYVVTGVKEPFDLLQIIESAYQEALDAAEDEPVEKPAEKPAEETEASAEANPEQASNLS